jgi:hypothetical protein
VCIEASGSSQGIRLAAALTRSLGTTVLKSTCSTVGNDNAPSFAAIANDIVVQELILVGSRWAVSPTTALQLPFRRLDAYAVHDLAQPSPVCRRSRAMAFVSVTCMPAERCCCSTEAQPSCFLPQMRALPSGAGGVAGFPGQAAGGLHGVSSFPHQPGRGGH